MDNKLVTKVVIALAIAGFILYKAGVFNKNGPVGGDDMRATAAVSLAAGTFNGDTPSPDPGPNPSPDEKPFQKDCDVCKGTGYVKHGDGHVTKCPNCKPNPSEPFDVQAEVDKKVKEASDKIREQIEARSAEIVKKFEEEQNRLAEATKPAPEPVKETPKVNAFASEVDKANELMLQASEEFLAGHFAESGELVKKARSLPDLSDDINRRIAKASKLLKEKGVNVEPVYVVPKKEYDAKMAKIEALRKDNEALKKWGLEWQAHSKAQQQSYPAAWKNSYGQSYSDGGCSSGSCGSGGCSSGSCGGGGRMMMRGGGGCSGGSCGGGRGFF